MRMRRSQSHRAVMPLLDLARVGPSSSGWRQPDECASEAGELSAVAGQGEYGGFGLRPADDRHLGDGQAGFLTEGLEAGVVVAALAGGVLDAAGGSASPWVASCRRVPRTAVASRRSPSPEMNASGSRLSSPCCQRALAKWPYLSREPFP